MRLNSPQINLMTKACMKAARSLIRDYGEIENLQVSSKGPGDFVSSADKRTEKILIEELQKAHPEYGIVTEEIGIKHMLISYDELQNEEFVQNDKNRCFYCREELSEKLIATANQLEIEVIVDGTHIDDLGDFRPGIDALHKNGIKSPLLETNFTKHEIREQAKILGLTMYDRPSNSCLASRIPWGQRVTAEKLVRIEMGELLIKQSIETKQVRVRDLDGVAKIEVDIDKIPLLTNEQKINEVSKKLQMIGFSSVIVDNDGYMPGKANA